MPDTDIIKSETFLPLDITFQGLTRQEQLAIWMRRKGVLVKDIAQGVGLSSMSVGRLFASDRIPTWRHEQFVSFGIPAELLPDAVDLRARQKFRQ